MLAEQTIIQPPLMKEPIKYKRLSISFFPQQEKKH